MKSAYFMQLDLRICLFLTILVSTLTIYMQKELSLLLMFILLEIWLLLYGLKKEVFSHFIWYGLLWGSLYFFRDIPIFEMSGLPLITIYMRRIMLSIMTARPLLSVPSGKLVSTFNSLKLPNAVTISITLIFRFLPTISEEYQQIRDAQKFRDIGTSFTSVILHPIKLVEYTLIPMLIRISKTADELAVSASVRGVGAPEKINCYYQVKFRINDMIIATIFTLLIVGIFVFEKTML